MQWHQLDHMQTICTSLQTDNHNNTSSLNFYRPDALPGAQPTVSKSLMCQQRKSDKVLIERVLQLFRFNHLKMRELLFPVLCPFFVWQFLVVHTCRRLVVYSFILQWMLSLMYRCEFGEFPKIFGYLTDKFPEISSVRSRSLRRMFITDVVLWVQKVSRNLEINFRKLPLSVKVLENKHDQTSKELKTVLYILQGSTDD